MKYRFAEKNMSHETKITGYDRQAALSHVCISAITLLTFTLNICLPVFFISCTSLNMQDYATETTEIAFGFFPYNRYSGDMDIFADIFVFNDDGLQRLDSYQRVRVSEKMTAHVASRAGRKRIVAVISPHSDKYEWAEINSFQAFLTRKSSLFDERKGKMLLSGTGYAYTGKEKSCNISISPITSEIVINSICCDFSDKPYKNTFIKDAKAYLINVNTSSGILQYDSFMPENLCNCLGYNEEDSEKFMEPGIIRQEIGELSDNRIHYPEISLYCYPNDAPEESPGSPFTKLVIEGKINGETCYYPISINRPESGHSDGQPGIGRNCRYIYDIILKSAGCSDPNMDIRPEMAHIICRTEGWNDRINTEIKF